MGQDNILAFRDAIARDDSLKKEVEAALANGMRKEPDADGYLLDLAPVVELAEQRGYSLTQEELRAAVKQPPEGAELTDEELEQVSGGNIFERSGLAFKNVFYDAPIKIGQDTSELIDRSVNPPGSAETTRHW